MVPVRSPSMSDRIIMVVFSFITEVKITLVNMTYSEDIV